MGTLRHHDIVDNTQLGSTSAALHQDDSDAFFGPGGPPAALNLDGPTVVRVASTTLPTRVGIFRVHAYRCPADGVEHVALTMGTVHDGKPVLVRVHSECLTGDLFGSRRCDCGEQLHSSLELIAARGRGVLIYLLGHEGRGIGLGQKLRAYELQESGRDTVDANLELGFPADARDYGAAAQILHDLGITAVHLVTNNPEKETALRLHGVRVITTVPSVVEPNPDNISYLAAKRDRMGHHLPHYDDRPTGAAAVDRAPARTGVGANSGRIAVDGRP